LWVKPVGARSSNAKRRDSNGVIKAHKESLMSSLYASQTEKSIGTTAKTGEVCPESGVWEVVGSPTTTAPIAKGNRFPPYQGKAVTWRLKSYA